MLIQPYNSATTPSVTGTRISGQSERFQQVESFLLELSNDGDSISITHESYASYEQLQYVAEATATSETDELAQSQAAMLSQLKQDYLQLIRQRVIEILQQATSNQSSETENTDSRSNATVSLRSVIEYRQASVYSMEKTTIAGLDTDYSADATANRIVQFALSFYDGSDRQEYAETVREAIMEGFEQAKQMLGGLPGISLETMALINERLDAFAQGQELTMTA